MPEDASLDQFDSASSDETSKSEEDADSEEREAEAEEEANAEEKSADALAEQVDTEDAAIGDTVTEDAETGIDEVTDGTAVIRDEADESETEIPTGETETTEPEETANDAEAEETTAAVAEETTPDEADTLEESSVGDADEPETEVTPAVSTYAWSPEGGECADCGETAERRWRADGQKDGELVCVDCKAW